jgi:beta-glucosidase
MKKVWTKASFSDRVSPRESANQELARQAASESIALLKNDSTLPIPPGRIALYGAGAATTIKGGTGSGEVNERHAVTLWEGLKNVGFTVTTEGWLKEYGTALEKEKALFYQGFFKKSWKAMLGGDDLRINIMADGFRYPAGRPITEGDISASGTDTCIYVVARQAGECCDRKLSHHEYTLAPDEIENIRIAAASYPKTILVINVGGSMDLSPLDEIGGINAIVYFCQQGMEGGNAFADLITGKISPSGCLTSTWARRYEDLPFGQEYSYLKGKIGKEYYKEGIYVGYRYFDSFHVSPRYEFGYGLTYSDFRIQCRKVEVDQTAVLVTAQVTNTGGKFSGKKVIQLYVGCPEVKLAREYQSLAAFGKTGVLSPGQSEELTLTFDLTDLAGYDETSSAYILEAGEYILRLGSSSRQTEAVAVLSLDQKAVTEQCQRVCPIQCQLEELSPSRPEPKTEAGDIPRFFVKASDVQTVTHSYEQREPVLSPKVQEWMKDLSTRDRMKLLMGTGTDPVQGALMVPGCAATTSADFLDKGIVNISLCDGPAGLRVNPTSVIRRNGKIKTLEPNMEMLRHMPPILRRFMFGTAKQGDVIYQYTTAFPVGTAMAQTWSTDILEGFGHAVGTEMEELGATFWLAPGMNIQRNPLGGRNYEYYSEDPLLTGKMAAAAIRGVQRFDGCYGTIKHFAANNQEQRRNHSDSVLSERALREIYLKGFKIAVREGGAKAAMTSYNMLNGTYTANSHDLCTKLLRQEWGFTGVVMSDWFATGKDMAGNGLAIKSGNDLIMPGGKAFRKRLAADLKNGVVAEAEIARACANVLEAIADSRVQKEWEALRKDERLGNMFHKEIKL